MLAAGTACSFFSIFAGEVQYGAPKKRRTVGVQAGVRFPNHVLGFNSLASGALEESLQKSQT